MKTQPRGVRCNNPGNIRHGAKWQGLADVQDDPDFCQFKDPTWGIRAMATTLIAYQDKHALNTVEGIINRWAPPNENDTTAYVNAVCNSAGFGRRQQLDLHRYDRLRPLMEAIIVHENGNGPLKTVNSWYDDSTIKAGLNRAGVASCVAVVAAVPVTKETVAATGTAGLGVAQLAEVAPAVQAAMTDASDHISSGSMVRICFGVATIALAGYIAWSQVVKHQNGVVA